MLGWIDLDDSVVVVIPYLEESDGARGVHVNALQVLSRGRYLVPVPDPADPTPFQFLVNNDEWAVAWTGLGVAVEMEEPFVTSARYDLSGAMSDGINPCDDLLTTGGVSIFFEDFCSIPGDVNFDTRVTFADFLVVAENFGMADAEWPDGDFDWDRRVGFSDFLLLSSNYGGQLEREPNNGGIAVPEPSVHLLWLAALALPGRSVAMACATCGAKKIREHSHARDVMARA